MDTYTQTAILTLAVLLMGAVMGWISHAMYVKAKDILWQLLPAPIKRFTPYVTIILLVTVAVGYFVWRSVI